MEELELALNEEMQETAENVENTENANVADELVSDLKAETEPTEEKTSEPVAEEQKTEEQPVEQPAEQPVVAEEPRVYAGKFKTIEDLENSYKNLQREFTKKSQQVAAEKKVSSDDFDNAVDERIGQGVMQLLNNAISTIQNPEHAKEAIFALNQFQRTGDMELIEKARGFLDPRIDRRLEVDWMNYAAQVRQEANQYRDQIELQPVREALTEIENEDPDWLGDPSHQQMIVAAIKMNRKVDVRSVKKMIQECEEKAVQRYIASQSKKVATEAEKVAEISPKTDNRVEPEPKKKNYDSLTTEEMLEEEYKNA